MLTPKQVRKLVEKIVDSKIIDYPTSATVAVIDGNLVDIQLPGRTTHMRNCRVVGDPNQIAIGQVVGLTWENDHGTMRPVVYAPGGGGGGENRILFSVGGSSGGGVVADGITIENSATQGLRVKKGGISFEHLSFIPALADHKHAIGEILPGWDVTSDGILFSDQVSINPLGTITLGRDPDIVKLGVEDATYRIWAGDSAPASAPFSVSKSGQLISSSAVIAGWTINATQIKKTGIILDSANDQIIVGAGAPRIYIDGDSRMIKSEGFDPGYTGFGLYALDGNAEFNNVVVRGTIRASVFNIGEITATAGSQGVFKSAAELYESFTTPSAAGAVSNAFQAKNNETGDVALLASGDVVRIKGWSGTAIVDIWMTITGTPDVQTGYTEYDAYMESGSWDTTFNKGMAIIDYGPSTSGYIMQSADGTIGASANISIAEILNHMVTTVVVEDGGSGYAVGNILTLVEVGSSGTATCTVATLVGTTTVVDTVTLTTAGYDYSTGIKATTVAPAGGTLCTIDITAVHGPWSQQFVKARIGNMYGSYGAGTNRYGIGIGDYDTGNYMSYNAETEGAFVIKAAGGVVSIDGLGIKLSTWNAYAQEAAIEWDYGNTTFKIYGSEQVSKAVGVIVQGGATDTRSEGLELLSMAATNYAAYTKLNASSGATQAYWQVWTDANASPARKITGVTDQLLLTGDMGILGGLNVGSSGPAVQATNGLISTLQLMAGGSTGPGSGDVGYTGNLRSYKSGTFRDVYAVHYFTSAVAVSGWAGTGRSSSTGSFTEANLGIPENANAVLVRLIARDSGAWPKDLYFAVGPQSSHLALACYPPGASSPITNGIFSGATALVPLSGGTLNWAISASGSGTMDCWVQVYGYSI